MFLTLSPSLTRISSPSRPRNTKFVTPFPLFSSTSLAASPSNEMSGILSALFWKRSSPSPPRNSSSFQFRPSLRNASIPARPVKRILPKGWPVALVLPLALLMNVSLPANKGSVSPAKSIPSNNRPESESVSASAPPMKLIAPMFAPSTINTSEPVSPEKEIGPIWLAFDIKTSSPACPLKLIWPMFEP